jgi:hypothetical protein
MFSASRRAQSVGVLRFSLVLTNDRSIARWQIHRADCPIVVKLVKLGAFADIRSALSVDALIANEHLLHEWGKGHEIMPCCSSGEDCES